MKNKDIENYNAGIYKALEIVKNGGVEALEKECKLRGLGKLNSRLSDAEYKKAVERLGEKVVSYYSASVLLILHDKFGFGPKRAKKFLFHFDDLADSLIRDYLSFEDIRQAVKDEIGIDLQEKREWK